MSSDDHNDGDKPQGRDDNVKPTRDSRGRWLEGYCPNPKGRPKKKKQNVLFDRSDLQHFGNTRVDVRTNGRTETMLRREALLEKMFETAMKGGVSMQRFLYLAFEKNDLRLAVARVRYDQLLLDWFIDPPDDREPGSDMPLEVEAEIRGLEAMLHHYYPFNYPRDGMSENDDGDDYGYDDGD